MKLTRNGVVVELLHQAHIDAYLADGWVEYVEEEKKKKAKE